MKSLLIVLNIVLIFLCFICFMLGLYNNDRCNEISDLKRQLEQVKLSNTHYGILLKEIHKEETRRAIFWAHISKDPELVKKTREMYKKRNVQKRNKKEK